MAYLLEATAALVHREECMELKRHIDKVIVLIEVMEVLQAAQAAKVWYLAGETEPPYPVEPCGHCC